MFKRLVWCDYCKFNIKNDLFKLEIRVYNDITLNTHNVKHFFKFSDSNILFKNVNHIKFLRIYFLCAISKYLQFYITIIF